MGKGYTATKAGFVDDIMYKAPWELMQQNIQAADARVNTNLEKLALEEEGLTYDVMDFDEENARAIMEGLQGEVDSQYELFQNDVLGFSKNQLGLKQLGRKIQKEYEHGDMSKYQGTKKYVDTWLAEQKKRTDVNQSEVEALKDYYINQFSSTGGTKEAETGNFRTLDMNTTAKYMDPNKIGLDTAKGWKANQSFGVSGLQPDGSYVTKGGVTKYVSYNEVYQHVYGSMKQNDALMRSLKQQEMLGGRSVEEALQSAANLAAAKESYSQSTSGTLATPPKGSSSSSGWGSKTNKGKEIVTSRTAPFYDKATWVANEKSANDRLSQILGFTKLRIKGSLKATTSVKIDVVRKKLRETISEAEYRLQNTDPTDEETQNTLKAVIQNKTQGLENLSKLTLDYADGQHVGTWAGEDKAQLATGRENLDRALQTADPNMKFKADLQQFNADKDEDEILGTLDSFNNYSEVTLANLNANRDSIDGLWKIKKDSGTPGRIGVDGRTQTTFILVDPDGKEYTGITKDLQYKESN